MFLLSGFFFWYFAGIGIYIIFLPKILSSIGYSPVQIGVIFSIIPLMRFLTPFLFLKIFNLTKKIYQYSLFISLLGVIALFFAIHNFYLLLLSIAVFGGANGLVMPYVDTIALEKLQKNYGKSRLWGSLGFMLIGLILAKYLNGYKIGLYFYLIVDIFVFIFGILISLNTKKFNLQKDKKTKNNFSLLKYWQFWLSILLVQISFGFFYNFFTIYENAHGISLKMVSYLWSVSIICEIVMFAFQNKILNFNILNLIKFSIFITSLRWLLLYLFPSLLAISFLTQTFHAISFALFHTATITYLYRLYEQKKLSMQFYHGISYGLGGFIGSLLSGYFYGKYLFLVASFIAILSLIILLFTPKKKGI